MLERPSEYSCAFCLAGHKNLLFWDAKRFSAPNMKQIRGPLRYPRICCVSRLILCRKPASPYADAPFGGWFLFDQFMLFPFS
ncbi:MAG: hypothetical protein J5544_05245, partial [Clostridia bacterium]|nr:hypothetical protein [Clostridia bacterium]